jgi:alcohol dehydrogenase class IV
MPNMFSCATRIVTGVGAISVLPHELAQLGARSPALVCDKGVADAGLLDRILAIMGCSASQVCAYVDPEPTVADAEVAAQRARELGADSVVALGGGSGLCLGKAVAIGLRNEKSLGQYAGRDLLDHRPAVCIAIPTTAGSGSEVSNALVLHDDGRSEHLVVRGTGYEPALALLDGELIQTVPHRAMIAAGLDALSHALEGVWVKGANAVTDALAAAASRQIYEVLPRALEQRAVSDLQTLLEASTMANLACGSAGLGLVHALSSYAEVRLPHGYQNGVLLPHVAAFNRPYMRPETLPMLDRLDGLYEAIGFSSSFGPDELTWPEAAQMATVALRNPFHVNNVRDSSEADLWGILTAAGVRAPQAETAPRSAVSDSK